MTDSSSCPFHENGTTNADWWPDQLDLARLNEQPNVMDASFNYAQAFAMLDLVEVKKDIEHVMTTSQSWWPADYGHYGPLFVRMAWHSAGTYRISDGRGGAGQGMQRFAPLNSWPDNANLDKARRLLWPVKQKYGRALSWADLMILAGNVAIESMGGKTFGFAGGREDVWHADDTYWGSETQWLADERYRENRQLNEPLGAVQMGLIYVNPEGPNGNADPLAAAQDIRETFRRMAMDDVETVALIAGGHTFGKAHGAAPDSHVGPEPEGADIEQQGFGWKNDFNSGVGADAITSGLEGAWTYNPIRWDNDFFDILFGYDWELTTSPAGAQQWTPKQSAAQNTVPDAHRSDIRHAPIMLTTDLALRFDPAYEKISREFHANPQAFADAFAKAWFKLTHRDMGPYCRGVGNEVPAEPQLWQDPVPQQDGPVINDQDRAELASAIRLAISSGKFRIRDAVWTAWASASTFRCTDKRGGANGARIALEPQNSWTANDPNTIRTVIDELRALQSLFNNAAESRLSRAKVSLADLIVLAGTTAIELATNNGTTTVKADFTAGRTDATAEQTDSESFAVLEPLFDGFRNYVKPNLGVRPEVLLIEKAALLGVTAQEMTALIGGLRSLGVTAPGTADGVLTTNPGKLNNDFFVNLLDIDIAWEPIDAANERFSGTSRTTGQQKFTATRVDLAFGSHSILRALCEVYAADDGNEKFISDFINAWNKVMNADRFDL